MNDRMAELIPSEVKVIEPVSLPDYADAMENLRFLDSLADTFEGLENEELIHEAFEKQSKAIDEYIKNLPEFDSTILYNNVMGWLKKNNMGIGNLECVLGVSTGYLAKTIKPSSSKNISIDVVWKIAKVLNIDINTLIERDLNRPESDIELLRDLLDKLIEKTSSKDMHWDIASDCGKGVYSRVIKNWIDNIGSSYNSDMLKREVFVVGKIYITELSDKYAVLVPYSYDDEELIQYELYFFSYEHQVRTPSHELIFNTTQEKSGALRAKTKMLYDCIADHDNDLHVSEDAKSAIKDFLYDLPF